MPVMAPTKANSPVATATFISFGIRFNSFRGNVRTNLKDKSLPRILLPQKKGGWPGPSQSFELTRVPVIFQDVVPFSATHETRRSRSGAKVEIGCNDFQGADLSRRLLHGSVANGTQ